MSYSLDYRTKGGISVEEAFERARRDMERNRQQQKNEIEERDDDMNRIEATAMSFLNFMFIIFIIAFIFVIIMAFLEIYLKFTLLTSAVGVFDGLIKSIFGSSEERTQIERHRIAKLQQRNELLKMKKDRLRMMRNKDMVKPNKDAGKYIKFHNHI